MPSGVSAKHIKQPHQRQRVAGHLRGNTKILQIAGHVYANKHHLKAAHKVARRQQQKAAVLTRLAQRLRHGLGAHHGGLPLAKTWFAQAKGQQCNQQHQHGQHQQGVAPAQLGNQAALDRHH